MLDKIRRSWNEFTCAAAGKRFETRYQRMRGAAGPARRALRAAMAMALIIAGLAMLFVPGPGILVILAGASLLAEQSLAVAPCARSGRSGFSQVARGSRIYLAPACFAQTMTEFRGSCVFERWRSFRATRAPALRGS